MVSSAHRPDMPNKEEKLRAGAESGDLSAVRRLILNDKVNIDSTPMFGETPLSWACSRAHLDVINFLLENGANPNFVSHDGNTPLGKAAMSGNAQAVRMVCEVGGDPNLQGGKKQWSALHHAAHRGHYEVLEVLDEFGADMSLPDERGFTAFELIASRYSQVNAEIERLRSVVNVLRNWTARSWPGQYSAHTDAGDGSAGAAVATTGRRAAAATAPTEKVDL